MISAAADLLTVDVAVVGSGPAGLSVALALVTVLSATGLPTVAPEAPRVLVLEAGGGNRPERGGAVDLSGDDPYPRSGVRSTRAAYLGGTSGIWSYQMSDHDGDPGNGERGCRYAPLDPVDFEVRPQIPHSGWPLCRDDLEPWYELAQPVAGLGPFRYDSQPWTGPGRGLLPLRPGPVETQMFQFGPASAWHGTAVGLLRRAGVQILTGAEVTDLTVDGEGRVTRVGWRRGDGSTGAVRARAVVLAAGGIENSRLLLRTAASAGPALGNRHDVLGRYWMEHPIVRGGIIVAPRSQSLGSLFGLYDAHWQGPVKVMAKLSIDPAVVRGRGLVSTAALHLPRQDVMASPGFQALTALRSPTGRAATVSTRLRLLRTVAARPHEILGARAAIPKQPGPDVSGWAQHPSAPGVRVLEMVHQTEQTPHPENRITLGPRRDHLDRPIPVLHWHWSADDRRRVTEARDIYAEAFAVAGLGRLLQGDWDAGQPRMIAATHHHMGGTRMSASEREGVVDPDCRVFGSPNLFVAGSSVFPTGGSVNPTLTIVALALRLGVHLRAELTRLPDLSPVRAGRTRSGPGRRRPAAAAG